MCVFVCISHTCKNLNFAKNVTTLLHWADDMKCLINSVKDSSSKKKKIPTYLPYFCSAHYANITIFFFWPNLALMINYECEDKHAWNAARRAKIVDAFCLHLFPRVWSVKAQIPPIGAPWLMPPLHGAVSEFWDLLAASVGFPKRMGCRGRLKGDAFLDLPLGCSFWNPHCPLWKIYSRLPQGSAVFS